MAQDTMTPEEAAAYLHLSPSTIKRKAREGTVPAAKTGRKWIFRKSDLDEWLAAGGTRYEQLVNEQMDLELAERKADPANRTSKSLEEVLKGLGL